MTARLDPPPCIGIPPDGFGTPLIRYVTVERGAWTAAIRGQITDRTAGYVACTLAGYGNKYGRECWPGVERLAGDVFATERTVIRCLGWLADFGFIHLYRRGARKLKEANEYHLALPAPLAAPRRLWPLGEPWWTDEAADRQVSLKAAA